MAFHEDIRLHKGQDCQAHGAEHNSWPNTAVEDRGFVVRACPVRVPEAVLGDVEHAQQPLMLPRSLLIQPARNTESYSIITKCVWNGDSRCI